MSDCYGEVGCDGSDDDYEMIRKCWYVDRNPMGYQDTRTWKERLVDGVVVPVFTLIVAALAIVFAWFLLKAAVGIAEVVGIV